MYINMILIYCVNNMYTEYTDINQSSFESINTSAVHYLTIKMLLTNYAESHGYPLGEQVG